MRHLSSARLDSHMLLTTVLAGDTRLVEKFRSDDLLPLASRMRVKLNLDRATPERHHPRFVLRATSRSARLVSARRIVGRFDAALNFAGLHVAKLKSRAAREGSAISLYGPPMIGTGAAVRPSSVAHASAMRADLERPSFRAPKRRSGEALQSSVGTTWSATSVGGGSTPSHATGARPPHRAATARVLALSQSASFRRTAHLVRLARRFTAPDHGWNRPLLGGVKG
jgi:hypothetical protein